MSSNHLNLYCFLTSKGLNPINAYGFDGRLFRRHRESVGQRRFWGSTRHPSTAQPTGKGGGGIFRPGSSIEQPQVNKSPTKLFLLERSGTRLDLPPSILGERTSNRARIAPNRCCHLFTLGCASRAG